MDGHPKPVPLSSTIPIGSEMSPESSLSASEEQLMTCSDTDELLKGQTQVLYHVFNIAGTMSIKCAVELGIPDAVDRQGGGEGRPVPLSELATSLPTLHPTKIPFLPRLMRLLVQLGFFATKPISTTTGADKGEEEEEGYVLTPFSKLLVKDNPFSMTNYFLGLLHPFAVTPWHHLCEWYKGDEATAFKLYHGKSMWEYIGANPDINKLFNETMASESRLVMDVIVRECQDVFEGIGSLVDVGGGTGVSAMTIARAFPGVRCAVYDLPHVVATVPCSSNSDVVFVGGDMLKHIPHADAIFLKCVLHDWNDEDCVRILKLCKEAIPPKGGKVIAFDIVVNSNKSDPKVTKAQLFFDAAMTLSLAAIERDEGEWRRIFERAGFSGFEIKHELGIRSLIVAYP